MDISSIALQGLQQAGIQLEAGAANLANSGAASAGPNLDPADIASQIVALSSAQTLFQLNVETMKTVDQLQQTVLNLFA